MENIRITCDSGCDLPQALADRYRIRILPMGVSLGNGAQPEPDNGEITSLCVRDTGLLPAISSVSQQQYRNVFRELTDQGYAVVHIALSGAISACCRNARAAAQPFPNVHVVDSRSFSSGLGQLALLGAELVGADYRPEEIVTALEGYKKHLKVSVLLQQSQYFRRSGKPGGFPALLDRLLGGKPLIGFRRGVLRREKYFRGDMEQSILSYVKSAMSGRKNIQTDRIIVTHLHVPQPILEQVKTLLQQLQPFDEIVMTPAVSVLSQRCGPGALGLSYLTRQEVL